MNITELDDQHIMLLEAFVSNYRWARHTLSLQYDHEKKCATYEKEIVKVYEWLTQKLVPSQKSILSQFGYYEFIHQLEKEIDRWKYETLPVIIER